MIKKNIIPFLFFIVVILFLYKPFDFNKSSNNNLDENNLQEITDISFFNDVKDKIVFFGRPTCPCCNELKPILLDILKEEHKKIYYFNTDNWRDHKKFQTTLQIYEVESLPQLVYIKSDGSIKRDDILDKDFDNTQVLESKLRKILNNIS